MAPILVPVISVGETAAWAPLWRALRAQPHQTTPRSSALLTAAGLLIFIDIEFGLAYLLQLADWLMG